MKKRDWFLVSFLTIFVVVIDQLSKKYALENFMEPHIGSTFGFNVHFNQGVILGSFSNLPPILRVVSLSTAGTFLIFTFFMIQYLLPIPAPSIRYGMSLLLGGILGNVYDRIAEGKVVDFIVIQFTQNFGTVANVADVIQWFGYFSVVYGLYKHGKDLWPENNLRKSYFINPKFQLGYAIKLVVIGLCFALVAGTLSYTYLEVTISELTHANTAIINKFINPFLVTFGVMCAIFTIILFWFGLAISHKAAGPLYAFEKFLEGLFSGKPRPLKLRSGDYFQHLEKLADKLSDQYNNPESHLSKTTDKKKIG